MGKSSAPEPPDPKETSAAQTGTNIGTAVSNAFLGNVNQNTPDGSLSYDQTGSYTYDDPYTGKSYDIPTFTATQTLSPDQQQLHDTNVATQQNLADIGQQQSGFLQDYLGQPADLSAENTDRYINDHYTGQFNKNWQQRQDDLRSQLANQGIKIGSDAYTRALADFNQNRAGAEDQLYGDLYGQAQNAITAQRNQPINEITALLSGSQVSQPNYVNTPQNKIPTTDVAGLINTNYNQRLQTWQQEQSQQNSLIGGLFGLGANLIASDRRVKKNVKKVGSLDGHSLYRYNYKGEGKDAPKHVGVMAQNVEKRRPDAVVKGDDGIRRVDYGALFSEAS